VQTLQLLEGNSAFVRTGQSAPVPQRQVLRTIVNGQIVERVIDSVEYRDVMTGFYALPRLAGDRVTLEISPQRDSPPTRIRTRHTAASMCSASRPQCRADSVP